MSAPDSLTPSPDAAPARPATRGGILRRLVKWFAWFGGLFMLLLVLFLTIPGFECDWRFPHDSGNPSLYLVRRKNAASDRRVVMLGDFIVGVVLLDAPLPPASSPYSPGPGWNDGRFFYASDHWVFHLQLWKPRP